MDASTSLFMLRTVRRGLVRREEIRISYGARS